MSEPIVSYGQPSEVRLIDSDKVALWRTMNALAKALRQLANGGSWLPLDGPVKEAEALIAVHLKRAEDGMPLS